MSRGPTASRSSPRRIPGRSWSPGAARRCCSGSGTANSSWRLMRAPCSPIRDRWSTSTAETVRSTLRGRLLAGEGTARLNGLNLTPSQCSRIRRIVIVACGTSWHAGLVGRHILEELSEIPVSVEYASEYRYRRELRIPGTLTIAISQSGETADTLEALRAAKAAGSTVIGLVNVVGSTIAREADGGIYLHAGPEIGVASTKAFTAQVVALLLLGLWLGRQRGLSLDDGRAMVTELLALPDLVARTLQVESQIRGLAERYAEARNALYLGRGVNFPVALEGALKLKES